MTKLFTLLGLALCWLPLQAQRLTPSQIPAAPYVLRPTPPPVKTLYLEDFFPQLGQLAGERGPLGNPSLQLGGKGKPAALSSVAIPVEAGQVVEAQLWAYAHKPAPWLSKRLPLALGAAVLSSQLSLPGRGEGGLPQVQSLTLPLLTAGAVLAPPLVKSLAGGKKAYARLRLYDWQGRLVQESTQALSKQARKGGELLSLRLAAAQKGYAQLQLVNPGKQQVWFEEGAFQSTLSLGPTPGLLPLAGDSLAGKKHPRDGATTSKKAPVKQGDNVDGDNGGGGFSGGTLPTVTIVAPPQPDPLYFPSNTLPTSSYALYPTTEPGSSSIVSGGSIGSNAAMNALTLIIPRYPVDGQTFRYKDSKGNWVKCLDGII